MRLVTAAQHREISAQFLDHAEDEFRRGDLLQASEKAWGAVSHCVNAVARQRSWPLGSHRRLIENANADQQGPCPCWPQAKVAPISRGASCQLLSGVLGRGFGAGGH